MTYFILYLTMLFVFFGYVVYIATKYGEQKSISASYYVLPDNLKFIFTFFCWGFALPAIVLGNSLLMFFAGLSILLVGASAAFKDVMTHKVHITGAVTGILLSQVAIFIQFGMPWLTISFAALCFILLLAGKYIKNPTWWIEILAFASIMIALISNL